MKRLHSIARLVGCIVLLGSISAIQLVAQEAPKPTFLPVDKVRLYNCNQGIDRPCFKAKLVLNNANGARFLAADLQQMIRDRLILKQGQDTLSHFTLKVEGQDLSDGRTPKRYTVLLIDHSGSMLEKENDQTRFHIAKETIKRIYENSFEAGVDYVAVIPFSAKGVKKAVDAAQFIGDKDLLIEEIDQLEEPSSKSNTGLFSAVKFALQKLEEERTRVAEDEQAEPFSSVLVLTDGRNDVKRGDDSGLDRTTAEVRKLADNMRIPIYPIGAGNGVNEDTLRVLAWPTEDSYAKASNFTTELIKKVGEIRRYQQLDQIEITFIPKQTSLSQVSGDQNFSLFLPTENGSAVTGTLSWESNSLGQAVKEGTLSKEEWEALASTMAISTPFLSDKGRFFLIFGILVIVLFILWTQVPKWLWKKDYDEEILRLRLRKGAGGQIA